MGVHAAVTENKSRLSPEAQFCPERQRLVTSFTVAVMEYLKVQSKQLEALLSDDWYGLEPTIEAARKRKEEAKRAVLAHQRRHGC
jgi:hypothetical protein